MDQPERFGKKKYKVEAVPLSGFQDLLIKLHNSRRHGLENSEVDGDPEDRTCTWTRKL